MSHAEMKAGKTTALKVSTGSEFFAFSNLGPRGLPEPLGLPIHHSNPCFRLPSLSHPSVSRLYLPFKLFVMASRAHPHNPGELHLRPFDFITLTKNLFG